MKVDTEWIQFPEDQVLLSRRVELPAFDHPLHRHPEIEVVWIERSGGERMIGDTPGVFREGDLYLLGSGLPHVFSHREPPDGGAEAEVLQFSPELLEEGLFRSSALEEVKRLLRHADSGLCYRGAGANRAAGRLNDIRISRGLEKVRLFFQLWEDLLALPRPNPLAGPGMTLTGAPLHSERLERVCSYLLSHFQEEISHKDMAKLAHYSPAAFSRVFKRATRKTFTRFLTEIRLGHACGLLRDTDWPVLRICQESGFQNLSNFNRRFQETFGMSPRTYRKQVTEHMDGNPPEGTSLSSG